MRLGGGQGKGNRAGDLGKWGRMGSRESIKDKQHNRDRDAEKEAERKSEIRAVHVHRDTNTETDRAQPASQASDH